MEDNNGIFRTHKLCPFHDDKEASLALYSNDTYYCFACRAHGPITDLGEDAYKTSREEKVINTQRRQIIRSLYREIANISEVDSFDLSQVDFDLYLQLQKQLFETGRFRYFLQRKLSLKVVRENYLGWTGSRYSFPIFQDGAAYSLTLRRSEDAEETVFKYFNLAGTAAVLYNERGIKSAKNVIITEGQMDCLSLMQFNIAAVCATSGAVGFQKHWTGRKFKRKNVFVLMDNDRGGKLGRELITEYFDGKCKNIYIPKEFHDINDFLVKTNPNAFLEHLRKEVKRANNI